MDSKKELMIVNDKIKNYFISFIFLPSIKNRSEQLKNLSILCLVLSVQKSTLFGARLMTYNTYILSIIIQRFESYLGPGIFDNIYNMAFHISCYIAISGMINPDRLKNPICQACCILMELDIFISIDWLLLIIDIINWGSPAMIVLPMNHISYE